ncbi:hypothetical protein COX21_01500 [Candidatus Falkowbacteria bacterium CG23_combo_of_CG06-09_8_20_14_all_41_10]|uniref:MGS-like domain-containing protein n=1 Tax=Candidatus Falkowbacteria bacterium CG23_combo_of_CG06-09_8_20_14_all_41_10 TaxID=1974571 RepID=A0A2G9ZQS7_9BACT|nr:MAG: hypothetical protein COX21_01500 [Candidatus Falkowbacteria bacterium CG23_combo_of_CG06-09_8_20_14_all_41_10]
MPMRKFAFVNIAKDDKVTELIQKLSDAGFEIISSEETAKVLTDIGLPVVRINSLTDEEYYGFSGIKFAACKYGENAYQSPAALYTRDLDDPLGLDKFKLISGTAPSYNNYGDLDRLLQTITHIAATFDINHGIVPKIAIGVKHGNACGVGVSHDQSSAIKKMVTGDPTALFGGLVMVNFPIKAETAELLLTHATENRRLLDGIIAPDFTPEAIDLLKRKGDKCRFIANQKLAELNRWRVDEEIIVRYVRGGFLLQPNYTFILDLASPDLKKYGEATITEEDDMLLAKAISDTSNSNTITIVKDGQLLANGVGQQSRVRGAKLAFELGDDNNHDLRGAAASSDSFFPYIDGPEVLALAGIKAIISTSGSIRDKEVIDFCQQRGMALYLIPDAKGRGFFNH